VVLRGLWVAAIVVAVAAPAGAQDTEAARRHFEAGTRAFETGDYELAVTEFQSAYEIAPHPDILFNIYSAAERAGQLDLAARALERHLAAATIEPAQRTALEERLTRLRERIARTASEEPPPPEEHREDAAPPEAPAPPPPSGVHPAGVGVIVAGVVLLASFAVFSGLSSAEYEHLEESCRMSCASSALEDLTTYNILADVSWIAGSVAVVTGIVLLVALPPEGSSAAHALAPWVSPDGGGIAAAGSW
jgi:tetratricopeptide (TPR) repeat protein